MTVAALYVTICQVVTVGKCHVFKVGQSHVVIRSRSNISIGSGKVCQCQDHKNVHFGLHFQVGITQP